ncbi:hypothetical protein E2C01_019767 [Portunus trituberculatus]|uniref:Uncharacterized protein n=1 Tax=Portunus trituberculatus TaxID=210409 RepID=A0A5B7DY58_PORTR|nr:hypothetical protein [Portunus trituberculatus]
MPSIKFLVMVFFHALAGLNPRNAYGPCLAKFFQLCLSTYFYLVFLPEVCLHSVCS